MLFYTMCHQWITYRYSHFVSFSRSFLDCGCAWAWALTYQFSVCLFSFDDNELNANAPRTAEHIYVEWENMESEHMDAHCICHRYCKTQNVLLKSELPNAYKTSSLMQIQKQFKRSFLRKFIHVFLLAIWNQTVSSR